MIFTAQGSLFNVGDTSFRRKDIIPAYGKILECLYQVKQVWAPDNGSQFEFYKSVVLDPGLLIDSKLRKQLIAKQTLSKKEYDDCQKRARTMTNCLVKLEFATEDRKLTEAGEVFLSGRLDFCNFEKLLNLTWENIIFLRQLLQLRVTSKPVKEDKKASKLMNSFFPFRCGLYLLHQWESIPEEQFCKAILSLPYNLTDKEYKELLSKKGTVSELLRGIADRNPWMARDSNNPDFPNQKWPRAEFEQIFTNRKSTTSVDYYYQFYQICVGFFENKKDIDFFQDLQEISKLSTIKKAFGFDRTPFDLQKKYSLEEFLDSDSSQLFKSTDLSRFNRNFYFLFKESKFNDLFREYSDMLMRIFRVSGLIKVEAGLVTLSRPVLVSMLIATAEENFQLSNRSSIDSINGSWGKNHSISAIFSLKKEKVTQQEEKLRTEKNIPKNISLESYFREESYNAFLSLIRKQFPTELLNALLEKFNDYKSPNNKKFILEKVCDSTDLPTIFEYILAICLHRISDESFNLRASMNLTLDGNGLPLSHAPGGDADIVATLQDQKSVVVLEATLMDSNSQKRGEMEPVIRHVTNQDFSMGKKGFKTYGFFVAPTLDTNVSSIFRACAWIQLEPSNNKNNFVDGVKILPLCIEDFSKILNSKIPLSKIFAEMNEFPRQTPIFIKAHSYDSVVSKILANN